MKKYNWSQSILENKLNMLIDEIIKRIENDAHAVSIQVLNHH